MKHRLDAGMELERSSAVLLQDAPIWSPDGNTIAFVVGGTDMQGYFVNIDEISIADRAERKLSADRWRWIKREIQHIVSLGAARKLVAIAPDVQN